MLPEIPSTRGHIDCAPRPSEPKLGDTARAVLAEGAETGSPWLELTILDFAPGRSAARAETARESVLFVVAGAGTLDAEGDEHLLEPQMGLLMPAGRSWVVQHDGPGDLRIVAVAFARPDGADEQVGAVRLADQEARAATGDRSFRVVVDPAAGCRAVTQFVGFVPPGRAPEHFHQYDEVIYILEGSGVLHIHGESTPFGAGATIHLPPRLVHCLENVGDDDLVVLGVFTPAGSPSDAFYPDGRRAYYDPQ